MANTPKPITREDRYYDYLINGGDFDLLPKPIQRREIYLYYLCENGFGGGGTVTPEQIDAAVERYMEENPIAKGDPGTGVSGVEKTGTEGLTDTYRMSFTDGTHFDYQVKNGERGKQGLQGIPGEQGKPGNDGQQGIQGVKGDKGDDGYPFLIYKEYTSLDDFNAADFPEIGLMFMVKSEDEHGSFPVYRYTGEGETPYSYITGLSQGEAIKGDKGDPGEDGAQGVPGKDGTDGTTYTPTIGMVTKGENPSASVTVNEETKTAMYNFVLPKGDKGDKGDYGRSIQSITKDENDNIIVTFSDGTMQNIGKLSVDISADFLSENGFGNIRYYNGKFQAYQNGAWVDVAPTPDNTIVVNMMPNPVQRIIGIYDHEVGKNKLKWLEPDDTVVDGQIICVVDKVVIRRKLGSVPQNENDGDLVITVERKDFGSHDKAWYFDNGVSPAIGDIYYYKAFAYSTTGFVNGASVNEVEVTAKDHYLYGYIIDQNESDPDSMVTYIEDNKAFSKSFMDYAADRFNYGDWQDTFIMPKPCMLNTNGTVAYYLDPDDYTKKIDGTDSDVANVDFDGNAMNEWGKIYWKSMDNGDGTRTFLFSDKKVDENFVCWSNIDESGNEIPHFYTPLYDGSLINGKLRSLSGQTPMANKTRQQELDYAHANNPDGVHMYETDVFCDVQIFRMLCVLISCSTNSKKAFGTGNNNSYVSTSNTGVKKTGTMNKKGMFWGDQTNKVGVKIFGREHPTGNIWKACGGWINYKGTQKIKMTYGQSDGSTVDGYNITGNGYVTIEDATPSGTSGGYISLCKFTENGIIPKQASGSSTTKFCDGLWFNNGQVNYAVVGGSSGRIARVGAFCSDLSSAASSAGWHVGAGLSCKPPVETQSGGES